MRTILKNHTIRKGLLLYRRMRYRKGHGVHSPFVFKLITQVIEEKSAYYSYDDIALIRKKLLYNQEKIDIAEAGEKEFSINTLVRQYDLKPREGELLFRLANFFKPVSILQIAPGDFFSTIYLTAYSEKTSPYVLQNRVPLYSLSEKLFPLVTGKDIDLRRGEYETTLPEVLKEIVHPDMIYLDDISLKDTLQEVWKEILAAKHTNTVFILKGPHQNRNKKAFWESVCNDPETTVALDLYSYGVAVFNKKFHKRTYKVYFKH